MWRGIKPGEYSFWGVFQVVSTNLNNLKPPFNCFVANQLKLYYTTTEYSHNLTIQMCHLLLNSRFLTSFLSYCAKSLHTAHAKVIETFLRPLDTGTLSKYASFFAGLFYFQLKYGACQVHFSKFLFH